MKFIYGERELTLEFRENEVQVITIENREYFSAFLQNLYNQSQGSEGDIILSEGEKILSLNKVAEIVWNPFSVDINNKKILGKLFQKLKTVSMEEQYAEICELNAKVVHYLDDLNLKMPYPIQFRLELDVLDLYKIYPLRDLENKRKEFIEDIELAQSYGQIDNTVENSKEAILQIMEVWYLWAIDTQNYGFFVKILEEFRKKIKNDAQVRAHCLIML